MELSTSGFWKLNVDGNALQNLGRVGFGGLLRNDDGECLVGFFSYIGISSNMHVELKTLHFKLKLA